MKGIPVRCIKGEKSRSKPIGGFKIYNLEKLLGDREMHQNTHRHDFYFVMLIENGKGEHTIDFQSYSISKYDVFFLKPGQVHSHYLLAGCKGYIIKFKDSFF